ncbi:RRXRR domain-containing protein [Ammonifex thiophilus]|uniref:HNH endonuclease n=1 Tax=Ammonifex thiophilus TaxID=444093 RepID=A0A3D8P468_9THEO|nr:HNH endonuclease [Ammonifex thiophilus]RDV83919.1 HNH endonuclease [Ammonifex thiophilus]
MVFTVDKNGRPGHPTRRYDMIRKLRKRGKARIVGGGASGKPPVVIFLDREFDYSRTVGRKLVVALDPGYRYIGFAVCEPRGRELIVYCRGVLHTRIPEIKGLMGERRAHRRFRRYIARYKKRRLSARKGRVLTKYKVPRDVRSRDRSNATLRHGVETHLNLYRKLLRFFPFPAHQVQFVMEDNVFDVRAMTWGKVYGADYQKSPRVPESERKCVLCGSREGLHRHHLVPRKRGGTEVRENKVCLCKGCHEDVHAGRVYLPVGGVKQWRELGTMNAVVGVLREVPWINFVPAPDAVLKRRELGLEKGHAEDALAAAAAFCGSAELRTSWERCFTLVKFRRHSRARVHAQRDRLYKINGVIVARNRRKKTDQKEASFADISPLPREWQRNLKVYPGTKVLNPFRRDTPSVGGDVWVHVPTGKRFVVTSVTSKEYLYSPQLKEIVGKPYVRPDLCRRVIRNEGIVVWE